MSVERQDFRNAMAQLGAAVNVITTDGAAGRAGMTASAVCSVTDEPPTVAVCINRTSRSHPLFKENGVLCVNTVSAEQEDVSSVFAGATKCSPEQRFETGEWTKMATGAPVLRDALVSFDGRITDVVEKGTHTVFFVEVDAVRHSDSAGLVYFRRSFHPVGAAQEQLAAA
ncbi:flavin reductase [Paraburkholderia tagetis]|uniref:Flavin reductase n=1 Tax=Paraburkholderia tagetis TaxID=2913261 RepID=A0A9X1UNZ1_9BURK|nr:flavin reductase [Paraburkholderia tagetis]MCG5078955.1 flavin reductase [Paraburkholderia tagetis]